MISNNGRLGASVWAAIGLGAATRAMFAFFYISWHTSDADQYFAQADAILKGGWINYLPNGYPLMIAGVQRVAGALQGRPRQEHVVIRMGDSRSEIKQVRSGRFANQDQSANDWQTDGGKQRCHDPRRPAGQDITPAGPLCPLIFSSWRRRVLVRRNCIQAPPTFAQKWNPMVAVTARGET